MFKDFQYVTTNLHERFCSVTYLLGQKVSSDDRKADKMFVS